MPSIAIVKQWDLARRPVALGNVGSIGYHEFGAMLRGIALPPRSDENSVCQAPSVSFDVGVYRVILTLAELRRIAAEAGRLLLEDEEE